MFENVIGHDLIKKHLKKALNENHLSQTLLFEGPDGIGKKLIAMQLANHLLKRSHSADMHFLEPEGGSGLHRIETLRQMMDFDHTAPFEGVAKVFILDEAHRMQPAAANALLKTLEEPSEDSTFILITSKIQEILPTILSRCSILHFQPLKAVEVERLLQNRGLPSSFAKFSHGSIKKAIELAEHPEINEQQQILFSLLQKGPIYPELHQELLRLEKLVEAKKEEDPVGYFERIDHLLALFLMWHRDLHAKEIGIDGQLLFFPDEKPKEPVCLQQVQKQVQKARLALSRNMKLSHCLYQLCAQSA